MAGDCKPGKEKNANGRCVKIKTCKDPDKEKNADGRCVLKCQSWQYRSHKSGRCLPTAKPKVGVTAKRAKRFQAADLALAKKRLRKVGSNRGSRKLHRSATAKLQKRHNAKATDLALGKKRLNHVSTRGTRRLHTSKTKSKSKTPGFWADFKF